MPTDLQFQNEFQTGTDRRAEYKNSKSDTHIKLVKKFEYISTAVGLVLCLHVRPHIAGG
jgi:hypothetical protein